MTGEPLLTDFSHERSITLTLMKMDYEGKENMSVPLLSNRKEERGSHMDDLTPPDFVGPSAAKPASAS
jgi:hypothetical protein